MTARTSPRRTTARDLAQLRALAARGVSITEAARQLGMKEQTVRYFHRTRDLGFPRRRPVDPATAKQAAARVTATMHCLADARDLAERRV